MAGRHKLRLLSARIEKEGGDEYVLHQIEEGVPIGTIAASLEVSRGQLYRWRDAGKDERKDRWAAAVKLGGEADAEKSQKVLDDVDDDPSGPQVSLAKEKSNRLAWGAAKKDPERFGDDKGIDVNVAIGLPAQLLGALRSHGHPAQLESEEAEEIVEAEFEVLPPGEEDSQPVKESHDSELDELLDELNGE